MNDSRLAAKPRPADSPAGTTIPRHIAGVLDGLLAMVVSIVLAKQMPDSQPALSVLAMIVGYLGYFFVFEILFCTTPAKFMNGLTVRNYSGGRCTATQTMIRTLMRLLEVNPFVLGALPAAASILWSRDKQRFGDKLAGTVVVRR